MYYQYLEHELEEILAKKQCEMHNNKITPLLDEIIKIDKELRSAGIDKDLLSQYTSLQTTYYRKLLGYAYKIGYRHARKRRLTNGKKVLLMT